MAFSRFLYDTVDAYTRHQYTIESQTKDGFAIFLNDVPAIKGLSVASSNQSLSVSESILEIARPAAKPRPPAQGDDQRLYAEALRQHQEASRLWQIHFELYEKLFGAQTLSESMELVFGSLLIAASRDGKEFRRHLLTFKCEVQLAGNDGHLRVVLQDVGTVEANWLPGIWREGIIRTSADTEELEDLESIEQINSQAGRLISRLGTSAFEIHNHRILVDEERIGVGVCPAILLRKRDSSSTLQLIDQIVQAFEAEVEPSEPFKMIVSPRYSPPRLEPRHDISVLPLEANEEQRETILSTLTERHVVIQGPPGTGKTHTIANLAALLMAEGRRVLITAENDQALTEVQNKLPDGMRALLLPFFRESGSASLERSVNELIQKSGSSTFRTRIEKDLQVDNQKLTELKGKRADAVGRLIEASNKDQEEVLIEGQVLPLAGHLKLLKGRDSDLQLATKYLNDYGQAMVEVSQTILQLHRVVTGDHLRLAEFTFPEGLPPSEDFSLAVSEFRTGLAQLPDSQEVDYSPLEGRTSELLSISEELQAYPRVDWSDLPFSQSEYEDWEKQAVAQGSNIDLAVGLFRCEIQESLSLLDELNQLSGPFARFDLRRVKTTFENVENLKFDDSGKRASSNLDDLVQYFEDIREADAILSDDFTGLLAKLVDERFLDSTAVLGPAIEEVRALRSGLVAPAGLPVKILDSGVPVSELLVDAKELLVHLDAGGKFRSAFGTPKVIKNTRRLLENVTVDGSRIDTRDEVVRVLEVLEALRVGEVAADWVRTHIPLDKADRSVAELLERVDKIPEQADFVISVVRKVEDHLDRVALRTASLGVLLRQLHIELGTELKRRLGPIARKLKSFEGEIRYDGKAVVDREDAIRVYEHLRAIQARRELIDRLPPSWGSGINSAEVGKTDRLRDALRMASRVASLPSWARRSAVTPAAFREVVDLAIADVKRRSLNDDHQIFLESLRNRCRACVPASPSTALMNQALDEVDPRLYRDALRGIEQERDKAELARRLAACRNNLRQIHPKLAQAFDDGDQVAYEVIAELPKYENYRDHKRKVDAIVGQLVPIEQAHQTLAELHREIRNTEARIAENRCWQSSIERLADRGLSSALSALVSAIASVPKTRTAKTFSRKLKGVRLATKAASPAIPCWLMSIDRIPEVLEGFDVTEKFDVIVVDEASQAWYSSLFLYALAEQVVVVGDDMQTSPTAGGVLGEDEVRAIVRQHIPKHRLATQVGDDLSIYDVASSMTAPVTLVDHFRCVPEIIAISNEMSYKPKNKCLLPIRTHSDERLEPVIRNRVFGARSTSGAANVAEIDAIVQQIVECLGDPRYAKKTIGVVVVGTNPNAHIKRLREELLLNIGPTKMNARKMVVGRASEFQGSERDVIFLSLVDAPPIGGRLTTRPLEYSGKNRKFVQQLNVAVSRARDQLWIFHSFGAEDLGQSDARHMVLRESEITGRDLEAELDKCGSDFERDVVRAIHDGIPNVEIETQVEALGYSIDIVVTSNSGERLAVECDGDWCHLSDSQVRSDLYRQRALERVGWKFYRFLASEWYSDPGFHVATIRTLLDVRSVSSVASEEAGGLSGRSGWLSKHTLVSELDDPEDNLRPWEVSLSEEEVSSLQEEIEVQSESNGTIESFSTRGDFVDEPSVENVVQKAGPPTNHLDQEFEVDRPSGPSSSLFEDGLLDPYSGPVPSSDSSVSNENSRTAQGSAIGRPSRDITREQNRELAAELRKLGKNPRGPVWIRAKELLKTGLSIKEAASEA